VLFRSKQVMSDLIAEAKLKDELWSREWDKEPVPSLKKRTISSKEFSDVSEAPPEPSAKRKKNKEPKGPPSAEESKRRLQRAQRFAEAKKNNVRKASEKTITEMDPSGDVQWDSLVIKGTSLALEKQYLRLTSAPDPSTVRPQSVLEESLVMLKERWARDPNYAYANEQLKCIRQDLTVQHIYNEFTVQVYETHARLALQNADLSEFNQCQTQLMQLHKSLDGAKLEFLAYRILYHAFTANRINLNHLLSQASAEAFEDPAVSHAVQVVECLQSANYLEFLGLLKDAPNMGMYLMEGLVERTRLMTLQILCKGYHPVLAVSHVTLSLGIASDSECVEYLSERGATFADDTKGVIDTKKSLTSMAQKAKPVQEGSDTTT